MGKQTRFYTTENDIEQLVSFIIENGGTIINEDGYEPNEHELSNIGNQAFCANRFRFPSFFIKLPSSKLFYHYSEKIDRKCIDSLISEIVEFSPCRKNEKNSLWTQYGRIWYARQYYDKNGVIVEKSKELDVLFSKLHKYIRKNYKISEDKFYYIGPDAYAKYLEKIFYPSEGLYLIEF